MAMKWISSPAPDSPVKTVHSFSDQEGGMCSNRISFFQKKERRGVAANVSFSYFVCVFVVVDQSHTIPCQLVLKDKSVRHNLVNVEKGLNIASYASVVRKCGSEGNIFEAKLLHAHVIGDNLEQVMFLGNLVIEMYIKCGRLDYAMTMFDTMRERNVYTWTAVVTGFSQHGLDKRALQLFKQMQQEGIKLDVVVLVVILKACCDSIAIAQGKLVHAHGLESGYLSNVIMGSALVNMYGKCGSLEDARFAFDRIASRNVASWNGLLAAYVINEQSRNAFTVFCDMYREHTTPDGITFVGMLDACTRLESLSDGKRIHAYVIITRMISSCFVGTAIINMYGKCGSVEDGYRAFDNIQEKNVVAWTAVITVNAQNGRAKEALWFFEEMSMQDMKPNKVTYISVLDACADLAALEGGILIHLRIINTGLESDFEVMNALVDMYAKCGSLDNARSMFDKLNHRDVISWNAVITAYAQNGHGQEALQLFNEMFLQGLQPNSITFLSIFTGCGHAGLFDEGHHHFICSTRDFTILLKPKHYGCMIDLLGRVGYLDVAVDFADNMPFCADSMAWTSLIGSSTTYSDVTIGKYALEHAFGLGTEDARSCVLLSSIFSVQEE